MNMRTATNENTIFFKKNTVQWCYTGAHHYLWAVVYHKAIYLLHNGLLVNEHKEKCSSNNDNVYQFVKRKYAQFRFI